MILKTKRRFLSHLIALCLIFMSATYAHVDSKAIKIFVQLPTNNAINVNPDTHLELTFNDTPIIGDSGQIRIYDVADNRLVDLLDISIPPGPTSPSTSPKPPYTPVPYEYISGHFTNANTKPGTPSGGAVPTPDKY